MLGYGSAIEWIRDPLSREPYRECGRTPEPQPSATAPPTRWGGTMNPETCGRRVEEIDAAVEAPRVMRATVEELLGQHAMPA